MSTIPTPDHPSFSLSQITFANSLRKTFPDTLNDPASIARELQEEAEAEFLHSHLYMESVQSTLTEILQTETAKNTLILASKADELASDLYHRTGKGQTPQASALLKLLRKFSQDSIQRINVEHFVRRTSAHQLARPRFEMTGSLRGQSANLYRTLRMEMTTLVKDTSAAVEIVGDFKWVFASIRNYDVKDADSTIEAVTLAEKLIDTWSTQFPNLDQYRAVHSGIEELTKFRDSVKALFRASGEEFRWTQENAQ